MGWVHINDKRPIQHSPSTYVTVFGMVILCIALYLHFGSVYAYYKWSAYIDRLSTDGVQCNAVRQNTGPSHMRKTYFICDNGEVIKYWEREWF